MILALFHHPGGVSIEGPHEMVYDLAAGGGLPAPAHVDGAALRWSLVDEASPDALLAHEVELDAATRWLMRCDRVDFGPGGIAYRHTHPGPGIRYLLHGQITIDSLGETRTYAPGEPWFERGADPVLARTSPSEASAFARVMLLPAEYAGQRTIRYVDAADAERPKTQRATVFCEAPIRS